jgi:hypothetical protein
MGLLADFNYRYEDMSSETIDLHYAPKWSDSRKLTWVEHDVFQPVVMAASPHATAAPRSQDEMIDLLTTTQKDYHVPTFTHAPTLEEAPMGGLGIGGIGGSIGMLIILAVVVGGGYYLYKRSKKG